jgi:hypothetical protein
LLFDGVEVKLNYCKKYGRFSDELSDDILYIVENGALPNHFINNKATMEHNFHLTKSKAKRNECAKYCSIRSVKQNPNTKSIIYNEYGYHVGMELIADTTSKLYRFNDKQANRSRRRGKLHSLLSKKGKGKLSFTMSKQSSYNIKRKEVYKITNIIINGENTVFNLINNDSDDEQELKFISISNIQRHFIPNYASTIAGIQGRK